MKLGEGLRSGEARRCRVGRNLPEKEMIEFFHPNSREFLPTFHTNCPDVSHFVQMGSHFAQNTTFAQNTKNMFMKRRGEEGKEGSRAETWEWRGGSSPERTKERGRERRGKKVGSIGRGLRKGGDSECSVLIRERKYLLLSSCKQHIKCQQHDCSTQ